MRFRIQFQTDRKYKHRFFVEVCVYPLAKMIDAVHPTEDHDLLDGGPETGETVALTLFASGSLLARVCFAEDQLDAPTIAHEAVHVVEAWARRSRVRREEAKAYGLEKLVRKIIKGIQHRGGRVDLC